MTELSGWNGITLFERLFYKYHIELEMADQCNCIAMTSVCDSAEMYDRLFEALKEIDREIAAQGIKEKNKRREIIADGFLVPEKLMESWQCIGMEKEWISVKDAEGRIAGGYVTLYPPGSPLLVPGEKIVKETVEKLRYYIYNGYNVLGLSGDNMPVLK